MKYGAILQRGRLTACSAIAFPPHQPCYWKQFPRGKARASTLAGSETPTRRSELRWSICPPFPRGTSRFAVGGLSDQPGKADLNARGARVPPGGADASDDRPPALAFLPERPIVAFFIAP